MPFSGKGISYLVVAVMGSLKLVKAHSSWSKTYFLFNPRQLIYFGVEAKEAFINAWFV